MLTPLPRTLDRDTSRLSLSLISLLSPRAESVALVDRGRIVVEGTPDSLKGELCGDAGQCEPRGPLGDADRKP